MTVLCVEGDTDSWSVWKFLATYYSVIMPIKPTSDPASPQLMDDVTLRRKVNLATEFFYKIHQQNMRNRYT